MSVLRGDCVEVMAGMDADSVDAIVCDPPYGLEFMGKDWDRLDEGLPQEARWKGRRGNGGSATVGDPSGGRKGLKVPAFGGAHATFKRCTVCSKRAFSGSPCKCPEPAWVIETPEGPPSGMVRMERWHAQWAAAALRVAKPGAYLLAFGGTRTVHRMTCALEDAGWSIRDMLMWVYLQGFPKSKASLKPAYEPIILCRKPGASRDLNIDAARIPLAPNEVGAGREGEATAQVRYTDEGSTDMAAMPGRRIRVGGGAKGRSGFAGGYQAGDGFVDNTAGRWPANVVMTEDVFGGGVDEIVGGGWQSGGGNPRFRKSERVSDGVTMGGGWQDFETGKLPFDTEGSKSRVFIIPKAPTSERVLSDGRRSPHPTQKPEALIRHLVTLVTPPGGLVLDPFLGSGTLGVVADGLGMRWVGIEREPEYADWAEDRIADGRPLWEVPA